MTRFARAKGSKASNQRLPEEATSWRAMRKQLMDSPNSRRKEEKRYERMPEESTSKAEQVEWSVFEETRHHHKKGKRNTFSSTVQLSNRNSVREKKKKKRDTPTVDKQVEVATKEEHAVEDFSLEETPKPNKLKRKCPEGSWLVSEINVEENDSQEETEDTSSDIHVAKKRKSDEDENTSVPSRKGEKRKESVNNTADDNGEPKRFKKDIENDNWKAKNKSSKKKEKGKALGGRQKGSGEPMILHIDNRTIEVIKYDGFPVKKEDAQRLQDLYEDLKKRNFPEDEIKTVMKLERRRAEKALSRERRKVCFHCRVSGHLLSDCPDLGAKQNKELVEESVSTGACFKCGSTEHSYIQCHVTQGNDFRFAKCFVCNEQGHIARQCPDNPRGLYPRGGGCRHCGAVTHLWRDCPETLQERQEQVLTLKTFAEPGAPEALDSDLNRTKRTVPKKSTKVIKF